MGEEKDMLLRSLVPGDRAGWLRGGYGRRGQQDWPLISVVEGRGGAEVLGCAGFAIGFARP